jgi:hypothetical protein
MAINLKSNPDGISGAIQVNGVDVVPFNGSGISSGVVKSVNGMAGVVTLQTTLPVVVVSSTTQTATSGNHYILTNVATTTVTLPASPTSGDTVWVTPDNGLATNVINFNGQNHQNVTWATDPTMILDNFQPTYEFRFINNKWRFI